MTKSRVKAIHTIESMFQLDTVAVNCSLFHRKIARIWSHGCIRNAYQYENVSYEESVMVYYFSYLGPLDVNVMTAGCAVKKMYLA